MPASTSPTGAWTSSLPATNPCRNAGSLGQPLGQPDLHLRPQSAQKQGNCVKSGVEPAKSAQNTEICVKSSNESIALTQKANFCARHTLNSLRLMSHSFNGQKPIRLDGKYPAITPYSYCAGNPVNLVDPEGMSWYFNNETGAFFTIWGTFFDDSDNSDDSDSIISNVVQFFYNYANVSEEGGSDILYSPGATI